MVGEITPKELWTQIQNGDSVQVIDIRPVEDYEAGHIPGAENIPYIEFIREISNHEWDDDIVVACPKGESSLQAARLLESYEGIDENTTILNLTGGYSAWDYDLDARKPD